MSPRFVIVAALIALGVSGCGQPAAQTAESAAKPTQQSSDRPTANVLNTFLNDEGAAQFVVEIKNPSDEPRLGVKASWKVKDADGVIIDSSNDVSQRAIPAHGSILFLDGDGDVKGKPRAIDVSITDDGYLKSHGPRPVFEAGAATFSRSTEADLYKGARDFDVQAVVTALDDTDTKDLVVDFVLRDAGGKILGGSWHTSDTDDAVPKHLAKGEKVRVSSWISVPSGTPARVDAVAYESADLD